MNGNDKHKWKWRFSISCLLILGVYFGVSSWAVTTPDPSAIKVQGADTLGNPVQVQAVQPGQGGTVQTPLASSANSSNAAQALTLTGAANTTVYVTGFSITGTGATSATVLNASLTPVIGSTMNYTIAVPAGVTTPITPIIVTFNPPLPCNAVNTNVTLSVPAFGAGNTNVATSIQGFRQ